MMLVNSRQQQSKNVSNSRLPRITALLLGAVATVLVGSSPESHAQSFYGYRGYPVVPVPVVPPPFIGGFYGGYSVGPAVRIQSPFFSMSFGADLERRVLYDSYRVPYGYVAPYTTRLSYRMPAVPRSSFTYGVVPVQPALIPGGGYVERYRYAPGALGGLPELSQPTPSSYPPEEPSSEVSLARLGFAAGSLADSLSRQGEEGLVWLDYLQPDSIEQAAASGELTSDLEELKTRYQGVTMNPDLRWVARTRGFDATYHQLTLWLNQGGVAAEMGDVDLQEPAEQPYEAAREDYERQMIEDSPVPPSSDANEDVQQTTSEEAEATEEEGNFETLPVPAPEPEAELDI